MSGLIVPVVVHAVRRDGFVKVCRARDMSFRESVYRVVSGIPAGMVMSYSGVASKAGSPGAARAVGTIMSRNLQPRPGDVSGGRARNTGCGHDPGKVPCHRVVRADGSLGGYSGPGGPARKRELLEGEGVTLDGERVRKEFIIK